jgi:hypothetical protein
VVTVRATETADEGHHVRRRDGEVEVHLAGLDLGGEVIGADDVGAGCARLLGGCAGGEHGHADVATGARGQGDGATHHLVRLAGVDAQTDGDLDGLVELRRGHLLHQSERLSRRVERIAVVLRDRIGVLLP